MPYRTNNRTRGARQPWCVCLFALGAAFFTLAACSQGSKLSSSGSVSVVKKKVNQNEQKEAAKASINTEIVTEEQAVALREEIDKINFPEASTPLENSQQIVDTIVEAGRKLELSDDQIARLTKELNTSLTPLVLEQSGGDGVDLDQVMLSVVKGTLKTLASSGVSFINSMNSISEFIRSHDQAGSLSSEQIGSTVCGHFPGECSLMSEAERNSLFQALVHGAEITLPVSLQVPQVVAQEPKAPLSTEELPLEGIARFQSAFLASGDDLPACDETNQKQMIFNAAAGEFQHCSENGWTAIDLDTLVTHPEVPADVKWDGSSTGLNALLGRMSLGLGSAALLDSGTAPLNLVQLDASGKLPAVDGSALTNLPQQDPGLGGDLSGTTSAATVTTVGGVSAGDMATAANLANAATNANTTDTIVKRDGSGNFTASTITATAFVGDGSGLTNIPASNPNAGGDLSGTISSATVDQVGGVTAANVAAGANLANAATNANTANAIVKRDASGNFTAGTITATAFSGDGSALTNLPSQTPSLSGDVTGNTGATTVANVGGVTAANVAAGANLANAATNANTLSAIVKRDGAGGFSAGTINATAFVGDGSGLTNVPIIGVRDSSRNLYVKTNTSSPDSQIDITADELILQNTSGYPLRLTSISETADLALSGDGGLDTGSEANSTWYYVFVISDGTSVSSLISTSETSPTLPGGYTYKALVSAFWNKSDGHIRHYHQYDRRISYYAADLFVSGFYSATYSAQDASEYIPPSGKILHTMTSCFANTVAEGNCNLSVDGTNHFQIMAMGRKATDPTYIYFTFSTIDIPLLVSQTFYLRSAATEVRQSVRVQGFTF